MNLKRPYNMTIMEVFEITWIPQFPIPREAEKFEFPIKSNPSTGHPVVVLAI